jgi:hypothetical protein
VKEGRRSVDKDGLQHYVLLEDVDVLLTPWVLLYWSILRKHQGVGQPSGLDKLLDEVGSVNGDEIWLYNCRRMLESAHSHRLEERQPGFCDREARRMTMSTTHV